MRNNYTQKAKGTNINQEIIEKQNILNLNFYCNASDDRTKEPICEDKQVKSFIIKKKLLNELDSTYQILSNFLFDSKIEDLSSSLIDTGFASFLKVVLGKESFNEEAFNDLTTLIISKHDMKLKEILKVRLNCISYYWNNKKDLIVQELKDILNSYKDNNSVPKWLINNIAIDLRNQEGCVFNNDGQKIIDSSDEPIFFPLLDRISNNIKDNIIKYHKESFLNNPYSSSNTFLEHVLRDLTSYYCVSVLYGSLTQILIFKSLLYEFACVIFKNTKDPKLFSKIIELNILNHNDKEIELLMRKYDGIYLNFIDFHRIIKSTEKLPCEEDSNASKLILLKWFGFYIKDEDFKEIINWFYEFCDSYIKTNPNMCDYASKIKDVFCFLSFRLDNNRIFKFILDLCETNTLINFRLACDIFTTLDVGKLKEEQQNKIHDIILKRLSIKETSKNIIKMDILY